MHERQDFRSTCEDDQMIILLTLRTSDTIIIPAAPPSSLGTLKKKTGDRLHREADYISNV